jgi:hypothetical protein
MRRITGRMSNRARISVVQLILFVCCILAGLSAVFWYTRRPVVHLTFDDHLDDAGRYGLTSIVHGDEVSFGPGVLGDAVFIGGTKDWIQLDLGTKIPIRRGGTLELWLNQDDWINPYRGGSGAKTLAAVSSAMNINIGRTQNRGNENLTGSVSWGREYVRVYPYDVIIAPGTWYHAALVYDARANQARLYLDGQLVGDEPTPDGLSKKFPKKLPSGIRIGTWHKANQAYRGYIDDLKLYDYPRSARAIQETVRLGREALEGSAPSGDEPTDLLSGVGG